MKVLVLIGAIVVAGLIGLGIMGAFDLVFGKKRRRK